MRFKLFLAVSTLVFCGLASSDALALPDCSTSFCNNNCWGECRNPTTGEDTYCGAWQNIACKCDFAYDHTDWVSTHKVYLGQQYGADWCRYVNDYQDVYYSAHCDLYHGYCWGQAQYDDFCSPLVPWNSSCHNY